MAKELTVVNDKERAILLSVVGANWRRKLNSRSLTTQLRKLRLTPRHSLMVNAKVRQLLSTSSRPAS